MTTNKAAAACRVVVAIVLVDGFDAVGKRQNRNGANDFVYLLAVIAIVYCGD